jgi:hypothetical protein
MTKDEIAQSIIKSGIGPCTLTAIECKICPCVGACVGGDKAGRVRSANDYLSEHGESTSSGKPVDHFEVGKWYKWVGPESKTSCWASLMIPVKDGKPRKCLKAGDSDYGNTKASAMFSDLQKIKNDYQDDQWHWTDASAFVEVPDPSTHDSVSGHPRIGNCRCSLAEVITDKVVGKPDEFNPSSVKSRSQRRAEILHGLTID